MKLRSNDADFIRHVDHWWSMLLPKLAPYAHSRGGPIIMVQVSLNMHRKRRSNLLMPQEKMCRLPSSSTIGVHLLPILVSFLREY